MRQARSTHSYLFLIPLALTAVLLVGCGGKLSGDLENIEIPFTGESVMGSIGDDPYRYFRYEKTHEAVADKEKVSEDGKMIGGTKYEWGGPVHFYHHAKRIVIYVGDDAETLKTIQQVFGPQFAGDE